MTTHRKYPVDALHLEAPFFRARYEGLVSGTFVEWQTHGHVYW